MIRKSLPALAALLWGCAEPPPQPHVDGSIIDSAVELAQARVDEQAGAGGSANPESGK